MTAPSPLSWGLADAIEAGTAEPIAWTDVPYPRDDVILTAPRDALKMAFPQADGRIMRAPASYKEQIRVARALGCASATIEWAKAIYLAATIKQKPVELVRTASDALQMGTLAWLVHSEDLIDGQMASAGPDDWGRGAMKGFYIDPMMTEQSPTEGCCNWGFVEPDKGPDHPDQSPGGRHIWTQIDYSQKVFDLVMRWARRISDGSPVDLVELQCAKFPHLAPRLRAEYGPAIRP